jgi:hypothetical protein
MNFSPNHILDVLDQCAAAFTFPALDNGYVYLAATRLSLHRSRTNWAIVIEIFGFSPRAGLPDIQVYTFANQLYDRNPVERYVSREAYEQYLAHNPYNESRFFYPIGDGPWLGIDDDAEVVAPTANEVVVRGQPIPIPSVEEYALHGIELQAPPQVQVFELCRFFGAVARDRVLATPYERRVSVLPALVEILQLEEWHHPDIVDGEQPSSSQTFQQLAQVLVTGNVDLYRPSQPPNTHWRHWPEGGQL